MTCEDAEPTVEIVLGMSGKKLSEKGVDPAHSAGICALLSALN